MPGPPDVCCGNTTSWIGVCTILLLTTTTVITGYVLRKRRSSILKSQRPPRTPLTELELNVATPPDTTKSRRVSFSRRTGVAEFITDEATNTWKTIYVEQNKSMESSLNDSAKNPPKQTVGHLGKRIFEQQFQEEEFYNLGNIITSNNPIAQELNMSLRGNLTQQFAALERDLDDRNLAAPQTNFELSSLTDHKSKIFVDDLTNPTLGEMSNKININFSSLEPVGAAQDKCYDLDEIEKDLLIPRSNSSQRPFGTMTNVSEQIEFDINMKPVVMNDEFDMSITDTVRNPQVEEVLHNYQTKNEKKLDIDNDWTLDKENIVMNPYVAPKESINFAINEEPQQLLVFDGKRLTLQSEHKNPFEENEKEKDFNKTLLPNDIPDRPQQRKTIVLNLNDDLPNFIDVPAAPGVSTAGKNITTNNEHQKRNKEIDFSTINVISNKTDFTNSHRTIIYDSGDIANISVTQAIITNILLEKEKRKTIVYDNDAGELSMTQALPSNVLAASKCVQQNKTVLYDVDNISITQAVPMNLLLHNKSTATSKSVGTSQSEFDLSFTQAVPQNMLITNKSNESNKRNTIVFDKEKADISITRVLPSNILLSDINNDNHSSQQKADVQNLSQIIKTSYNREILIDKSDSAHVTLQSNTTLGDKKGSKDYNMSETKMLSLNILADNDTEEKTAEHRVSEERMSRKSDKYISNMSITEAVPNDILVDNPVIEEQTCDDVKDCDISMTQAIPSNIILEQKEISEHKAIISTLTSAEAVPNNINTINAMDDLKNITTADLTIYGKSLQYSDRQLHPTVSNVVKDIIEEVAQIPSARMEHSRSYADMSMTQVLQPDEVGHKSVSKRGTIVFSNDEMGDISVTRAIPTNILLNEIKSNRDNTLLIFENVNNYPLSSVSASEGMLTKSEENVPSKINTSYADILAPTDSTVSHGNPIDDTHKNTLALRTLQQAKEELQKSIVESDNANKDLLLDNIYNDHTKPLSDHNETLLNSMNYIDCLDQKLETHSLKSATEHKHKDVFVYQAVTTHKVSKHQGLRTEQGDVKSDRTINRYEENTSRKSNAGKESEVSLLIHDVSNYTGETKMADAQPSEQKHKTSILAELLNMSGESLNMSLDGVDDKNVMVGLESELAFQNFAEEHVKEEPKIEPAKSIESTPEESNNTSSLKEDVPKQPSYIADQKEVRSCIIQAENIHRPPVSLGYEQENEPPNKEEIVSSHSDTKIDENNAKELENENDAEDKCVKEADDTKELLEMLTDFTDKTIPSQQELDASKSSKEIIDVPIEMQEKSDGDTSDSKESCDKLQNDIEIKQLQPSQEAMEGIESENYFTNDATVEDADDVMYEEVNLRRKSGHVSRDVVKTLQFDESNDEIKCNSNSILLKKTAPVDISSSKDSKAKVIPTFLNDVSDDLKSLMQDLVKPSADLMPYHVPGVDRLNKKSTTTVNKELQTNIITSSQIDIIDINSYPVSESNIILTRRHEDDDVEHTATDAATSADSEVDYFVESDIKKPGTKQVLIFDHKNPLNNVILCPSGKTDIHRYSPKKSDLQPHGISPNKNNLKSSPRASFLEETLKEDMEIQRISTQYNIDTKPVRFGKQYNGRICEDLEEPIEDRDILLAMNSRKNITTTEVNTLIAMKCNKDLLQASSSLTLIDEETSNAKSKSPAKSPKTSPVKVIFKLNDAEDETVESSFESSDAESTRAQKRNYNRAKYDQYKVCSADVTPRPLTKMQKLSSSPRYTVQNYRTESNKSFDKPFKNEPTKRFAKSNLLSSTKPKVRTTTIVQHVTVCKLNAEEKEKLLLPSNDLGSSSCSTLKTETISRKDLKDCTSTELTSFTSSNAMKEMEYMPSLVTVSGSQETLHTDTDDCSDLMSHIESLSFLGRECECEGCEPDAWRFLLLRRRLRLTVRVLRDVTDLPPPAPPAPSAPVISITIEPVHQESDAVACASVRLACEAMRYECVRSGGGREAAEGAAEGAAGGGRGVGALLRRCVGVSRAAARWARLMADARAHLAFSLAHCGKILLTVANFHMRRVWQVTLRIELVVEDARELAWPRASHVTVREVTPGAGGAGSAGGTPAGDDPAVPPHAPDLRRVLARVPHDWGHVPRTIWKIFRHLKNKTEDDELFWLPQSR
ncbi:PREDICTED: uncharacterized protein LOC106109552 isoform X2 [Papilio polytes]|uniref:uncharacterized protein LOC106109552 isoform X2 n=1 Tax=Papilio polytes TaxID=76194 RepID=UPI000675E7E8|nr:PREDICTED: uncharacterized protein LOC106109552 isoform X2 [Papilio polytes]